MTKEGENSVKQDQIHDLLFSRELGWQEIIYDLINTEQLDAWDIDIIILSNKYLGAMELKIYIYIGLQMFFAFLGQNYVRTKVDFFTYFNFNLRHVFHSDQDCLFHHHLWRWLE